MRKSRYWDAVAEGRIARNEIFRGKTRSAGFGFIEKKKRSV